MADGVGVNQIDSATNVEEITAGGRVVAASTFAGEVQRALSESGMLQFTGGSNLGSNVNAGTTMFPTPDATTGIANVTGTVGQNTVLLKGDWAVQQNDGTTPVDQNNNAYLDEYALTQGVGATAINQTTNQTVNIDGQVENIIVHDVNAAINATGTATAATDPNQNQTPHNTHVIAPIVGL